MSGDNNTTEYRAGVHAERARILALIPKLLSEAGHHRARGCLCCTTAEWIETAIRDSGDDVRIVDGVMISGPQS